MDLDKKEIGCELELRDPDEIKICKAINWFTQDFKGKPTKATSLEHRNEAEALLKLAMPIIDKNRDIPIISLQCAEDIQQLIFHSYENINDIPLEIKHFKFPRVLHDPNSYR